MHYGGKCSLHRRTKTEKRIETGEQKEIILEIRGQQSKIRALSALIRAYAVRCDKG